MRKLALFATQPTKFRQMILKKNKTELEFLNIGGGSLFLRQAFMATQLVSLFF